MPPEVPPGCLNFKVPKGLLPFQGGGPCKTVFLGAGGEGLGLWKKQRVLRTAAPAVTNTFATDYPRWQAGTSVVFFVLFF